MRSGISVSNETRNQLVFDDQNDFDSDVYVNHAHYNKGACLDIENLLHHLTTEKGKKDFRNKLILDAMIRREEEARSLIDNIRAATPDIASIPTQVNVNSLGTRLLCQHAVWFAASPTIISCFSFSLILHTITLHDLVCVRATG
jgi:hypothetical protein